MNAKRGFALFIRKDQNTSLMIIVLVHDHLISPLSYESWVTLLEAAKVRKHDGILKIARNVKEGEVPVLFYHRKCRSVFTLKRDLESLK